MDGLSGKCSRQSTEMNERIGDGSEGPAEGRQRGWEGPAGGFPEAEVSGSRHGAFVQIWKSSLSSGGPGPSPTQIEAATGPNPLALSSNGPLLFLEMEQEDFLILVGMQEMGSS